MSASVEEEEKPPQNKHEERLSRVFDEVMGLGHFADSSRGSATSSRSEGQDETKEVDTTSAQVEQQPVEEEDSNGSRQEEKMEEGAEESSLLCITSPSSVPGSSFTMGTKEVGGGGGSGGAAFDDAQDGLPAFGPGEEEEDWHFALPSDSLGDVNVVKDKKKMAPEVEINATQRKPFPPQPREVEDVSTESANTSHSSQDHTPENSHGGGIQDRAEETEDSQEGERTEAAPMEDSSPPPINIKDEPIDEGYDAALLPQSSIRQIKEELEHQEEELRISSVYSVGGGNTFASPTALAMLQAMSEAESEGGEKTDGESDEGEVKDPSTEEESSSEDWEPIPRKRPRVLLAARPPTPLPMLSHQPADTVTDKPVSAHHDSHETGKDGTLWIPENPGLRTGRVKSNNVLTEGAGPTAHARHNIDDPLSAFMCLMDPVMLKHICDCTVAEARRRGEEGWKLSLAELKAFIALLLARGVHNGRIVEDLWSQEWGLPFFSTTMARHRYRDIMRFLRFDKKDTRRSRLGNDKFALVSEVWDRLVQNSIACYKPGSEITAGEQLLPTKTGCPFTQYMPNKPDKFGIKFWLAVDVESKYMLNGFPYLGKDPSPSATQSQGESVVLELMEPFLGNGRNVTTEHFFTSLPLAHKLLAKNTSLVGTTNKNNKSLPPSAHQRAALFTTKVMKSDKATLTIYQEKRKKNVCILSTMHSSVEICDDTKKKPETVNYYNRTKVGVDMLDKMLRQYSARATTRRWPVAVFYNILDIAAMNACVLYRGCTGSNPSRPVFILELCKLLRNEHISKPKVGILPSFPEKRRNCGVKRNCRENKTTKTCMVCQRGVCGQCKGIVNVVCADCVCGYSTITFI
ncbi:uncharacterized protein isoform X2 [Notothenia coriiceps]|uniref:Uncharacterized protein isoform X2 n=1 Tax=Notothenia coriiceps TaxID=8208 RepID=A0A6I9MVB2_9TELE|nr:PREDICTED: uncharacterized protein LOC104942302 isoform X2 [Notothenia coriiceps]